jgi:alkylated DNA nucleotide flippase Atl1
MSTSPGSIVNLFIKSQRNSSPIEHQKLSLKAGFGIDRDIHANGISPRQILIVRQEDLQDLSINPGELSENMVISGVDFDRFTPGSMLKFASGAAIRLTFHCEPCKRVAHLVESLKQIENKRGILGVVINDGLLISGDLFEIQPQIFPALSDIPYERFLEFLTKIPMGKVITYKQIITGIGVSDGYFRAIPKYLQKALTDGYPVHRVLNSEGALTPHIPYQREQLEAEGIRVIGSFVSLADYAWNDPTIYLT